ncbi:MAG: sarcosine oxidase subunit gamma family protein [Burkholderiaceae bacterium]|nr:sarcosine oxidase subunit gamma family protein [Burkholderiaceae bacterium]
MNHQAQSFFGTPVGQRQVVLDLPQYARLVDRSDLGCVLVSCAVNAPEVAPACSEALGLDLPLEPGQTSQGGGAVALWLTPRSWLVQCAIEDEGQLADAVNRAFADRTASAALYSDALAWLELQGPGAWDLLTEGAFVSLEQDGLAVAHAKRTLVAGIPAVVLRSGDTQWLLGVERSRARYFVERLGAVARTCATGMRISP